MLTRNKRKKLRQRGVDSEFLTLESLPKLAKARKEDNISQAVHNLVECSEENNVQSCNVGSTDYPLHIRDCYSTSECATGMAGVVDDIGEILVPDSTTADDKPHSNLDCISINTRQDGIIDSQPCYCDIIILPPIKPEDGSKYSAALDDSRLVSLGLTRNAKTRKIDELEKEVELPDKSATDQAADRPSSCSSFPTNYEYNSNVEDLVDPGIMNSMLDFETDLNETDHKLSFDEELLTANNYLFEFGRSTIDQEREVQPNQLYRINQKVKVLDILRLPPGTIDPQCPIDTFHEPIDLSMKRAVRNDWIFEEPLDLSVHKEVLSSNPAVYYHSNRGTPETASEDDDVLQLDASYACFDTLSCSSKSGNSESLDRAKPKENYIQPNLEEENLEPYVQSSMYLPEFSTNLEIRRRVYEILDYPCFRYFGYSSCKTIPCKFRHKLVEAEQLQEILESESITIIEKCYLLVQEFDRLFLKYFQVFCIIFGQKGMIKHLVRMVNHCEKPKRPVTLFRHIITGFRLCKLDEVSCFAHLIQNSSSTSPKSLNILIWIMFDLDVVLEFRDELRKILNHDGFYISTPNLTRLLGVCSRTKDCELIRIIYEAIENYPEKVKEQLHWSLRPQFIRMDK